MKIIKPDTLALLHSISPRYGAEHGGCEMVLACVASFPFAPHVQELLPDARLWECAQRELPQGVRLDEGRMKPRAEYLVYGSCHVSNSVGLARAQDVDVRVGSLRKRLTVFGERYWQGLSHSDPTPFPSMPMSWENAYGGTHFRTNPLGKGMDTVEGLRLLPNVLRHGEVPGLSGRQTQARGAGRHVPFLDPTRQTRGQMQPELVS